MAQTIALSMETLRYSNELHFDHLNVIVASKELSSIILQSHSNGTNLQMYILMQTLVHKDCH